MFGRQLTSRSVIESIGVGGGRGLPGNGFKITVDGQYDMDNKRLCNVADPTEQNDAVSVHVMQSAIQQEIRLLYPITSALRKIVDDHDIIIQGLQTEFTAQLKKHRIDIETVQDLSTKNSQFIVSLDERLRTLERSGINGENNISIIETLQSTVNEKIKRLETDGKTGEALAFRNSQVIAVLDERLRTLENGREKGSIGGRNS